MADGIVPRVALEGIGFVDAEGVSVTAVTSEVVLDVPDATELVLVADVKCIVVGTDAVEVSLTMVIDEVVPSADVMLVVNVAGVAEVMLVVDVRGTGVLIDVDDMSVVGMVEVVDNGVAVVAVVVLAGIDVVAAAKRKRIR